MRKCEKCGKEFEGTVCPECSAEYDLGKKVCPQCGEEQPTDAKYCRSCSAPLNKTVICTVCGTEDTEGNNYCENCGAQIRKLHAKDNKKSLTVFGAVCLILSALIGCVFTLLAGVTVTSVAGGMKITETQSIFYYFGDAYREIDLVREAIKIQTGVQAIGDKREFGLLFPAILGTVVSAVGNFGTIVLFALSAWFAYKKLYKKEAGNFIAPAIGSYLGFVAVSAVMLSLSFVSASGVDCGLSPVTLAGLIIGGIFCGLGVFSLAFSNGEKIKSISKSGFVSSVLLACIFIVIIALCSQPAVSITITDTEAQQMDAINGKFGVFPLMQVLLTLAKKDTPLDDLVSLGSIGGASGIAVTILSAVIVWRKLTGIAECENKSCFVLCLVTVLPAVFYFVGAIVMCNDLVDIMYELVRDVPQYDPASHRYYYIDKYRLEKCISKSAIIPIVIMVMSVLACIPERIFKDK